MVNSKDITPTQGRLTDALNKINYNSISTYGVEEKLTNAVNDSLLRTGNITKVYPYLDKAEVKLHNVNKKVLCKFLHRFGGGLLDLYTPSSDRWEYDDNLKERYLVPRGDLHVVVARLHDDDSDEDLLLGFYQNEELVGLNPANPGNLKLAAISGNNQHWIKFGFDGLDLRLPNDITVNVGGPSDDMNDVDYAVKDDVYSKDEIDSMLPSECNLDNFYSKSEVDELLQGYEERIQALEALINTNEG